MTLFKKKSRFSSFLDKLPFRNKETFVTRHSIQFHNLTQFGGALNDNIFKYLIVFLLIALKGVGESSTILFWVGIVYVLPFLLFSSGAGVLADRFSKSRIIVTLKMTEIIIILLSFIAFALKSEWGCYALMFLLSMQSAIFGPPKYSIIPELVKKEKISKANGLITSFTYLAIIIGTFLASAVTQITNRNFIIAAMLCFVIAVGGFITALFIPYTKPKGTKKRINPLFVVEIYQTLRHCWRRPHLFVSIFASGFFLFVGAFVQLEIIPFGIASLGMSETGGGYLFLVTAIGIATGASLAGRLCKKRVELGLSCFAGFFMAALLGLIYIFNTSFIAVITCLILLGVCGGLFIVPFESFIQTFSPEKRRGQIVAAANFLSFCGVALAPIAIYVMGGLLKISPAMSFFIVGWIVLIANLLIIFGLTRLSLHFFARKFFLPFLNIEQVHTPLKDSQPLVLYMPSYSRLRLFLLMGLTPEVELFLLKSKKRLWDRIHFFNSSVKYVYTHGNAKATAKNLSNRFRRTKGAISVVSFAKKSEEVDIRPELKSLTLTSRRLNVEFSLTWHLRTFWKFADAILIFS